MPCNIEIKARVAGLAAFTDRVASLATSGPVHLTQDDTFFACPSGRLKLRVLDQQTGELIFYRRDDQAGPTASSYLIAPTSEPARLRECLTQAYGQVGRVVKDRVVYLVGRTRVHLDRVAGLGEFVELEVVLAEGEPADDGAREAHDLMGKLGITAADLVEGAYVDLLAARGG
jgi:predicted adenylyl cyclase CyaB